MNAHDGGIRSAVARIMASRYQPKVGDRVRVVLTGECPGHYASSDSYLWELFHGKTGIVSPVPPESRTNSEDHPDHPYYVRMDFNSQAGGIFSAVELEPLEPAATTSDDEGRAG